MRWFEGNISDAVALSKSRKAIFVVFVKGTDTATDSMSSAIDSPEVSSKLESNAFVAIQLNSGEEAYRQFAQIYQVVPVPSLFFIGRDGRPLEIVAGSSSSSDILKRIDTVVDKTSEGVANGSVPSIPPVAGITPTPKPRPAEVEENVCEENSSCLPSTSAVPEKRAETLTPDSGEQIESEVQNRIETAKVLIEKNRVQKLEEEKNKEKEKEVERRKVGQDMQRLRRWQQDQEYKQLKEEREKEKREEAAARERVRNQIAQDRAERAQRNSQVQESKEPERVSDNVSGQPVSRSGTARLQLRFPDGAIVTHQLPATASLRELRQYVSERLNQSPATFSLSTTFPRRILLQEEDSQTMSDLELVPTAVLLVLPASSAGVVRSAGSASSAITPVTRLFWALLTPVVSILMYVKNLIFGQGGAPRGGPNNASNNQRPHSDYSSQVPPRRIPPTSEIRRQGNSNIHRLAQAQDSSDEDNNTWNGNSTQQM